MTQALVMGVGFVPTQTEVLVCVSVPLVPAGQVAEIVWVSESV